MPVLITYNSRCIKDFCGKNLNIDSEEFKKAMIKELNDKFQTIYKKSWPAEKTIKIIFFLFPFESIADLKEKIEIVEKGMRF